MSKWFTHRLNSERQNIVNRRYLSVGLTAVLFVAALLIDGIIFPGFFGFRESFLTIIFLVVMLLRHKADTQVMILGIVLAGLAEFYWGLKLGTLILPLLLSAGTFFILNKFFNLRSMVFMIISGVMTFTVFWEASALLSKIL